MVARRRLHVANVECLSPWTSYQEVCRHQAADYLFLSAVDSRTRVSEMVPAGQRASHLLVRHGLTKVIVRMLGVRSSAFEVDHEKRAKWEREVQSTDRARK